MTTVADWSFMGHKETIKEIQYYRLFAGRRGFLPSGPRAVHYYTKKCKNSEVYELKIGFLLPYIPTGDLYQYVFDKDKPPSKLTERQFLNCFMDIAFALKDFEENKIVHGDIAMSNILIDHIKGYEAIKLMCIDFGKSYDEDDVHLFARGREAYRSPERIFYSDPMKNEESKQFIRKHAHGLDIWGAGMCLLMLMGIHDKSVTDAVDRHFELIIELTKAKIDPTLSFEEFCKIISPQHNQFLSNFVDKIGESPELSLVKRMVEIDPAKRPSGIEIYDEVSNLLLNLDPACHLL